MPGYFRKESVGLGTRGPRSNPQGGYILPLENLEYIEVFKEPLAKIMEMAIVCKQIQSQG